MKNSTEDPYLCIDKFNIGVIVNSTFDFSGNEILSWLGFGLNRTSTNFMY